MRPCCKGCSANVRRILEGEGGVSSASVNLANESALVRIAIDAAQINGGGGATSKVGFEEAMERAARAIGDSLAEAVTAKGFPTSVREACGKAVVGHTVHIEPGV